MIEEVEEKEVEDSSTQESEEDGVVSKTKPRNFRVARLAGRKRKLKRWVQLSSSWCYN